MVKNNKGELKMKRIIGMILVMVMLLSLTVGYAQSPTVTPEIIFVVAKTEIERIIQCIIIFISLEADLGRYHF